MKRKKTGKNIALRIFIGILALILIITGAGFCYYQFRLKPQIANHFQQLTENGEGQSSSSETITFLLNELESVLREEDVQEYINSTNPHESTELLGMIEEAKNRRQADSVNQQPQETPKDSEVSQSSEPVSDATPPSSSESTYDKIKNQVEPKDLKDALALSGKVDVGYILGLLSGGLTIEEKRELKAYLMGRLSSSEISRGIQLFTKYSYIL